VTGAGRGRILLIWAMPGRTSASRGGQSSSISRRLRSCAKSATG
jgi:hypothetical protein